MTEQQLKGKNKFLIYSSLFALISLILYYFSVKLRLQSVQYLFLFLIKYAVYLAILYGIYIGRNLFRKIFSIFTVMSLLSLLIGIIGPLIKDTSNYNLNILLVNFPSIVFFGYGLYLIYDDEDFLSFFNFQKEEHYYD